MLGRFAKNIVCAPDPQLKQNLHACESHSLKRKYAQKYIPFIDTLY